MKDISPETLLDSLFQDRKKQVKKVFIQWGDKVFVRHTARGDHWLYRGSGAARHALIECIYEIPDCPLKVPHPEYSWADYEASMENISWWVGELEKRGIIQYVTLTTES